MGSRWRGHFFSAFFVFLLAVGSAPGRASAAGVDLQALDRSASPCEDFYQFACGSWLKTAKIPEDRTSWSRGFDELSKNNEKELREILTGLAKGGGAGDDDRKLGTYYATCRDEAKAETASPKDLAVELARVAAIHDAKSLAEEVAHLHLVGGDVLFAFGPGQDSRNSSLMIATAGQGGLGLPNRDYYLGNDPKMVALRQAYVSYLATLFHLSGETPGAAAEQAAQVLAFETELAKPALSPVALRDPIATYNRIEIPGLEKATPVFDWADYLKALTYEGGSALTVSSPTYFQALNGILAKTGLDQLKTYLRAHVLDLASSAMGRAYVDAHFAFAKALTGVQTLAPRWKRCVRSTDGALGEALGRAYVARDFPPVMKERSETMVTRIEAAMKRELETLPWMDAPTRAAALAKLAKVVNMIGYPDKWRDYGPLTITGESYLADALAAAEFNAKYELHKIGKPVDRREWDMTPPTVNAYYAPENNQMVFPAGILQPPFFDRGGQAVRDPSDFGGIGMVMGHELTHGFDDQGRLFDGHGNLTDWWSKASAAQFKERAACLVRQYGAYSPLDGLHINGELTLGENIADQGGIRLSYRAFEAQQKDHPLPPVDADGFTPEQRYFLGFAQSWCMVKRPQAARLALHTDPHSPAKFRVNGPVSNFPAFAEAFGCPVGAPMAPANRCVIWE